MPSYVCVQSHVLMNDRGEFFLVANVSSALPTSQGVVCTLDIYIACLPRI